MLLERLLFPQWFTLSSNPLLRVNFIEKLCPDAKKPAVLYITCWFLLLYSLPLTLILVSPAALVRPNQVNACLSEGLSLSLALIEPCN